MSFEGTFFYLRLNTTKAYLKVGSSPISHVRVGADGTETAVPGLVTGQVQSRSHTGTNEVENMSVVAQTAPPPSSIFFIYLF